VSEMRHSKTARGFDLIEFSDLYGVGCSVQASSLATDDAIWIGVDDADPKIHARQAGLFGITAEETSGWVPYPIPTVVSLTTRMHLNREQVASLLPVLQRFVDTGEIAPEDANG
jgi:hypothetical protein